MRKLDTILAFAVVILFTIFMAIGFLMSIYATPAEAQANCVPRRVMVEQLWDQYGETRRSIGLSGHSALVETFANDQSGSWTIVVTTPDGLTCLVASGQAFELLNDELPQAGDDT